MDRNQQAAAYLELLHTLEGGAGIAFRTQLQEIRFDYSRHSLQCIDAMLFALRSNLKIDYGSFLTRQPAVNFVVALNFYLGTTVARLGNFPLQWIDHARAREFLPDLPARLETEIGCIVADGIYFPANVVTEILFGANQERCCTSFADGIVEPWSKDAQRVTEPLARPEGDPAPMAVPAAWKEALDAAGALAAWGIAAVASGAAASPVAMLPSPDGERLLLDFSTFGHAYMEAAVQDGLKRLQRNPDGVPWQALYYDGFVNLPAGRRDALVVELRVYEPEQKSLLALFKGRPPARASLLLAMAIPYRSANSAGRFASHAPRMVECSYAGPELPAMLDAFYRGIYSAGRFQWDRHYAEEEAAPSLLPA
jgi:hypothetical protein